MECVVIYCGYCAVSQRADRPPSGKSRTRKESHDSLAGGDVQVRDSLWLGCTVEPLYKGHTGTVKIVRGVLYSEVKLYTKVLALDQNKCPL